MNINKIFSLVVLSLFLIFSFTQFSVGQGALPEIENPWRAYIPPRVIIPWDINMFDKNKGYIVGYYGSAYQTVDGGKSWTVYEPLWLGDSGYWYRKFYRQSPTHWMVGGLGVIRTTQDAGTTWHDYWSPQDPFNEDHIDIYDINMKDSNTGYACGGHAMVMKTTDGGITWQKQRQGRGIFNGIACNNELSNPVAVGYNTSTVRWITYDYFHHTIYIYLAHDTSYGLWGDETSNTWTVSSADDDRWGSVFFLNSTTGWVSSTIEATNVRYVLKTLDGGKNWTRYSLDPSIFATISNDVMLQFLDENNGFAGAKYEDRFYKTTDGGVTWTRVSLPAIRLTGMYFTDKDNGWLTGYDDAQVGYVLKTQDGGNTWNYVFRSGLYGLAKPTAIHFNKQGIGYMGTIHAWDSRGIYQSLDNGSTWHCVGASSLNNIPKQMYTVSIDSVYAVVSTNLVKISTNGGQTWSDLSSCQMDYPGRMQFYGELTGWICGYDNNTINGTRDLVYKTTNGGMNWNLISQSSTAIFPTSLYFIDNKNGWMAGSKDTSILVTHDGGINWLPQYVPTTAVNNPDYRDIYFSNANKGWLVDGYGDIFTTQDGGSNWSIWGRPISSAWNHICFKNSTTGWIVGEKGRLLYTCNGGDNWFLISESLSPTLCDIAFAPDGTGWIASASASNQLYKLSANEIIEVTGMQNKMWEVYDDPE